jgi:peptidoglycan/LPS O-acetylase OafA/YrhL
MKTDNTVIEAWRGLAAWLVLYTHYWAFSDVANALWRFSHTGVDLFFVISGFVFAPYWWNTHLQGPRHLTGFMVRRFFRIYPAYAVALLVYVWLKSVSGAPLLYVNEHLLFFHVQSREMAFYYNAPFWSLPAEVEFYLALPVLCWLTQKIRGGFFVLFASAILARVFLGAQHDWQAQDNAYIAMHHLPGLLCEFMLGALAWRAWQVWGLPQKITRLDGAQVPTLSAIALLLAVGLGGWLALAQYFAMSADEGVRAGVLKGQMGWLAALCFAWMVLASVLLQQRIIQRRLLQQRPLKTRLSRLKNIVTDSLQSLALFAGKVSYGVYLLHSAMLSLVQQHLGGLLSVSETKWTAVGLTLFAALVMHELWEGPCRTLGRDISSKIQGH